MAPSKLFAPIQVGTSLLAHRIVMAPLTRCRANSAHVHGDLAVEYYSQRACVPGTLLITEATTVAPKAGGNTHVPGIWSQEQIDAWKKIADAVHARGSFIYMQLRAYGRAADPRVLAAEDPSFPYVSSSATPLAGKPGPPRALTGEEIAEYVQLFATAARNAVHGAGFDGVEIHGANGYLVDQFIQDVCNKRTDAYGGDIANRTRFALEIADAVVDAVGAQKTGIRLSPWSTFNDMDMEDPIPTFSHLISQIRTRHPEFAYIHLIEPRISGSENDKKEHGDPPAVAPSNDFARALWAPKPLILAGAFTGDTARDFADRHGDIIAFGRYFVSNPDLVTRVAKGIPFTPYDRATFYTPESAEGYIDYPFAAEQMAMYGAE